MERKQSCGYWLPPSARDISYFNGYCGPDLSTSFIIRRVFSGPRRRTDNGRDRQRWGVPDGTREAVSGALVYDDDLMTAALCSILDRLEWYLPTTRMIVRVRDPLEDMDWRF